MTTSLRWILIAVIWIMKRFEMTTSLRWILIAVIWIMNAYCACIYGSWKRAIEDGILYYQRKEPSIFEIMLLFSGNCVAYLVFVLIFVALFLILTGTNIEGFMFAILLGLNVGFVALKGFNHLGERLRAR